MRGLLFFCMSFSVLAQAFDTGLNNEASNLRSSHIQWRYGLNLPHSEKSGFKWAVVTGRTAESGAQTFFCYAQGGDYENPSAGQKSSDAAGNSASLSQKNLACYPYMEVQGASDTFIGQSDFHYPSAKGFPASLQEDHLDISCETFDKNFLRINARAVQIWKPAADFSEHYSAADKDPWHPLPPLPLPFLMCSESGMDCEKLSTGSESFSSFSPLENYSILSEDDLKALAERHKIYLKPETHLSDKDPWHPLPPLPLPFLMCSEWDGSEIKGSASDDCRDIYGQSLEVETHLSDKDPWHPLPPLPLPFLMCSEHDLDCEETNINGVRRKYVVDPRGYLNAEDPWGPLPPLPLPFLGGQRESVDLNHPAICSIQGKKH